MVRISTATASVVRAPNHLGDLVMALPALEAAGACDVMVAQPLIPLVKMLPREGRILPLERSRGGFLQAARMLRAARYRRGILLTPSLSSAFLFAAGRVRERRGVAIHGRGPLLTDPVQPVRLTGLHRASVYVTLVTGSAPVSAPTPSLSLPDSVRERWRAVHAPTSGFTIGVFPGSNASSRRWDADRYAALVRHLHHEGANVIVFGGPEERALTASVAGGVALDAGGRTDLPLLAAGLASCDLLVTNDSGPMHLATAVGTTTVSLWGAGDPAVTGPLGERTVLVRHP
ncbi:MAG TPA: glycosyltransferase family 9 protein, partial [Gemmatimonadaceae bacterium]|nr:glycosyltransferase family 9 protein [Gemmatimonadaceae bacterium]